MRITPATHEHGSSGKVYKSEGEFDVADDQIAWSASLSHSAEPPLREPQGSAVMIRRGQTAC